MSSLFLHFTALVAGHVVARILLALGISFVTFQGLDYILSQVVMLVHDMFTGLPGDVAALLGLADVDLAINLVVSGYTARITMMSLRQMRL